MGKRWWSRNVANESDWQCWHLGAAIHCIALLMYGLGIFHLEVYHPKGTSEPLAIANLSLFGAAAFLEFFLVFFDRGAPFIVFNLIALIASFYWAWQYEPLILRGSPDLHDRDVNSGFD